VGSVSFLNSIGTAIGPSTPFTVASEMVVSVALPFTKASTGTTRIVVRPQISVTTTSGTPCNLVYTVETYDSTSGVTHVYLTGTAIATPLPIVIPTPATGTAGTGGQGNGGGAGSSH
jgi:hypothetical protein